MNLACIQKGFVPNKDFHIVRADDSNDNNTVCDCNKPEFYNIAISGKYIGWTEIHCNNCGKLVAYIDSSIENIDDFKIMCKSCIINHH